MAVEISGIVVLTFELDKDAAALEATDQAMQPAQGAGSVTKYTAIQDGAIRGLDGEIEAKQSAGDDVIFSVYIAGSRDDDSEVTVAGAGSSAGTDYATKRFDKDKIPVKAGESIVVKVKSTDATNCKPAGMVAVVYVQLGESEI